MPFPLAAIAAGVSIASGVKNLFGKGGQAQPRQGMGSPFMSNEEWNRYMALRDILKKVRSPYMASLYGRNMGGNSGGY